MYKVSYNFQFDILQSLIKISIWVLNTSINFDLFSLFMETMTCFLDRPFIVIFNLGLDLLSLLIIFLNILYFLCLEIWKCFLVCNISLVLNDENKTCTYDFIVSLFLVGWLFFLKNFKISLILGVFARIGEGNLMKLASLSDLLFLGLFLILGANLDRNLCLNDWLSLLAISKSHPDS